MGDHTAARVVGCGIVRFDRESMDPMLMRDFLYVPGLEKNLMSVSMIQDRGLGVYVLVTERNSYGLGYHNRQLDSRNQSFPICNRN